MTETATIAVPAFEQAEVQDQLRTARKVRTSYEPAGEFIKRIKDMAERSRDFLVPFDKLKVVVDEVSNPTLTEEGFVDNPSYKLRLAFQNGDEKLLSGMYEHVLGHLCGHTSIGDKAGMPVQYLKRLLSDGRDKPLIHLAAANVNELLGRRHGEVHTRGKAGQEKAVFVRTFRTDEGLKCRAILSDRYFPIRTLDMVTIALAAATGKNLNNDSDLTAVKGAFMFDQHLSVTGCSVGFVNPSRAFDLRNPDRGIIEAERVSYNDDGRPTFHYPGGSSYQLGGQFNYPSDGPRQHLVLPAARIKNSETGGGSAEVQPMLFETVCTNGMVFAKALKRTHVSQIMSDTDDYESDKTKKKAMEWVISKMTDAMQQVFDVEQFRTNCLKFLNLAKVEVKSVKEVTEHLLSAIPGGDGLLEDVLKAYEQFTPGKDTVLDVQRALTSVAQDQSYDKQETMEELAGSIVAGERSIKKELLVNA